MHAETPSPIAFGARSRGNSSRNVEPSPGEPTRLRRARRARRRSAAPSVRPSPAPRRVSYPRTTPDSRDRRSSCTFNGIPRCRVRRSRTSMMTLSSVSRSRPRDAPVFGRILDRIVDQIEQRARNRVAIPHLLADRLVEISASSLEALAAIQDSYVRDDVPARSRGSTAGTRALTAATFWMRATSRTFSTR